jgi:hypothetical protein
MEGISKGRVVKPALVLIYGPDGVGKSTFGAEAPNPIFLGPEDGSANLDVARFDNIKTFSDVRSAIRKLLNGDHNYKTVVLDSIDWMEPQLWKEICEEAKVSLIEEAFGGYGKGYTRANQMWVQFMSELKQLREVKKMNIIAIAHSHVKPFNDPSQPLPYDRYMLKLNEKAAALWREFVDCVLFAQFEVVVKKDKNQQKAKAYGEDKRLLFSVRRPSFDAKNRYGIPFELPLSWASFYEAMVGGKPDSLEVILADIDELKKGMAPENVNKMLGAVEKASGNVEQLIKIRNHARVLAGE